VRSCTRSPEATHGLQRGGAAARAFRFLREWGTVIRKYEGRLDHFHADGALAVFGVPQAHGDDPGRAIRAAIEIREAADQRGIPLP